MHLNFQDNLDRRLNYDDAPSKDEPSYYQKSLSTTTNSPDETPAARRRSASDLILRSNNNNNNDAEVTTSTSSSLGMSTRQVIDLYAQQQLAKRDREAENDSSKPASPRFSNADNNENTPSSSNVGVLSHKDVSFFRQLQEQVDQADPVARCARYGWTYNTNSTTTMLQQHQRQKRRIFFGALIASEPWELLEIVAAETHAVYEAIVFVESNRTQNFTPRHFQRLRDGPQLARLFGLASPERVQVRAYVNEDHRLRDMDREHDQRAEILRGWKELGMQGDDIGLLADSDESFTRDFLRAVQSCDGIDMFDYESHRCEHSHVKIKAVARVFEGSPECITQSRKWHHPDMIIGHCIEGIGDSAMHPVAPRIRGFVRGVGFGSDCYDWEGEANITDKRYPLWNALDFRRTCGGRRVYLNMNTALQTEREPALHLDQYTAFHFHNFFTDFDMTRFKYLTYGHHSTRARKDPIEKLSNDLQMMYRCVKGMADIPEQTWKREPGGFNEIRPFLPIYFRDEEYRRRRHLFALEMVEADERLRESIMNATMNATIQLAKDRQKTTDSGIPVDDPELYTPGPYIRPGDSSTATVLALATNFPLAVFKRFIGSLRRTGYQGHIIVGLSPDVGENILDYLRSRKVIPKVLEWTNCTYTLDPSEQDDIFKKTHCAKPYGDIKIRWSRFPLARDWLEECGTCTGPVLFTDARDTIFQRDPFGPGSPLIKSLQVFQEHANMTTKNWLADWPIGACKGVHYDEPMLCSGTTIGTRAAMLRYLEIMYAEMKDWISKPVCRFNINGDDQSIHNHLFYSGQLPFATSIPNRVGGIVNTIGHQAAQIVKAHHKRLEQEQGIEWKDARKVPFEGANNHTWIGVEEYSITNADGLFVELDGSVSRVVHQWDRFDLQYYEWLHEQPWALDLGPIETFQD